MRACAGMDRGTAGEQGLNGGASDFVWCLKEGSRSHREGRLKERTLGVLRWDGWAFGRRDYNIFWREGRGLVVQVVSLRRRLVCLLGWV